MSVFLELLFDRNVNIYKVSSFKDFENVISFILFPNHFSVKHLNYSLLWSVSLIVIHSLLNDV